ncbi:MAG: tetratricopeptide repeat protein [Chitinispirillaceae bacterium]|nr:tetratricopeptide repeat protein [Chitinispirillaceae bacterium]
MAIYMTEALLRQRLQSKPDSLAFSRLADLYRKSGNIAQAIDLCSRGVQRHPEYVTGHIILGRCYLEQENLDKAVTAFLGACRIDRRNIVAMKMLADIFMRQGLREKAGDLYALLAGIDPYNDVLMRSASANRGTGKRDLYDILGIPPEAGTPVDIDAAVPDAAATMIVSPQELGIEPAAPSSAGQVDVRAATELTGDVDIDKVIAEATEITGSDIADRMTSMFGEDEKVAEAAAPAAEPVPESAPEEKAGEPASETIEVEPLTEVPDGDTITARIDDLFGRDTLRMPPIKEAGGEPPAPFDERESMVEELMPLREEGMEETMILDASMMKLSATPATPVEPASDVPGPERGGEADGESEAVSMEPELVTDAQESAAGELFKDAGMQEEALFEAPEAASGDTGVEAVTELIVPAAEGAGEDMLSGEDVAERIGHLFEKKEDGGEPAVEPSAALEKTPEQTGPGAGAELFAPAAALEKERPVDLAAGEAVSGDDVVERLDEIFKKEVDKLEAAGTAVVSLGVPGVEVSADATIMADSSGGPDEFDAGDELLDELLEQPLSTTAPAPAPVEAEAADAAIIEIETSSPVIDETAESFRPVPGEDTITGDDVVERLEGIFEKKKDGEAQPPEKPMVSLGMADGDEETAGERTVVFESLPERAPAPVEAEAADAAIIEIETSSPVLDETAESPRPGPGEDTITGDDVVERLEGIFEKKDVTDVREDAAKTAAQPREDTAETSESVIETVDIITGSDVEKRLSEYFREETEPPGHPEDGAKSRPVAGEPVFEHAEDAEETIIAGDLDDLFLIDGKKPRSAGAPVEPLDEEEPPSGMTETLDALAHEGRVLTDEPEKLEGTAVFEDFAPGSVPEAPPRPPEVPLFLTETGTSGEGGTVIDDGDKKDLPGDLPDHVLTPTLADLYFQQGQPQLALSIYQRLLQKNGENEKYKERIAEIEKAIAEGIAGPQVNEEGGASPAPRPKKVAAGASRPVRSTKKRSRAPDETERPLSGVKLKRRPKIVWRKKTVRK